MIICGSVLIQVIVKKIEMHDIQHCITQGEKKFTNHNRCVHFTSLTHSLFTAAGAVDETGADEATAGGALPAGGAAAAAVGEVAFFPFCFAFSASNCCTASSSSSSVLKKV
jgi:hypothetical protein